MTHFILGILLVFTTTLAAKDLEVVSTDPDSHPTKGTPHSKSKEGLASERTNTPRLRGGFATENKTGKWYIKNGVRKAYIYVGTDDKPYRAESFTIADESGSFVNGSGKLVGYFAKDILFEISKGKKYRHAPTNRKVDGGIELSIAIGHSNEEAECIRLINEWRQQNRLAAVTPARNLREGARNNSVIQSTYGVSGHYAPLTGGAEIAFFGPQTAQGAVQGWKDSVSHNSIMLTPGYTHVGCSKIGNHSWTARFR